jgi:hypothetical protein
MENELGDEDCLLFGFPISSHPDQEIPINFPDAWSK